MYVFRRKKCYLARYYLFSTIVSTNAEPPGTGWLACPTSIDIINMFKTTIQMLNGDGMFSLSREPADAHVIVKDSTLTIPVKFRNDIKTLQEHYAQDFREGLEVSLTLKEALVLLPRDRARADAYNALASWMRNNLGITLTIKSQKTKK